MKDEATGLFSSLLEGLSVRTRWVIVVILLFIGASMFVFYEYLTRNVYYSNLEKQVLILERLNDLANDEIQKDTMLVEVYEAIVSQITEEPVDTVAERLKSDVKANQVFKFLASASIGILGFIAAVSSKKTNRSAIIGTLMMIVVFGSMGLALPTIIHPSVNYILIPIIQVSILAYYASRLTTVKELAMQNACRANMRTIASQLVIQHATKGKLPESNIEFRAFLPELQGIVCPACKKPYNYSYINKKYLLACPNREPHGSINDGEASWVKEANKVGKKA